KTHMQFIELAIRQGFIVSPFGRVHEFKPKQTYKGLVYNESDITNHPNQGLGADVVSMIRVMTKHKMDRSKLKRIKLINTVHDSIVVDAPDVEVEPVARLFSQIFRDVPKALSRHFSVDWNIPIKEEITVGHNMKELSEYIL
ncbi:DNA polymerase, partial [uncultured Flavobacterium sp.]|uniref:DNA polymerase n=1 Tax=uncultured Flavobacterium sp. TaxID=165435 RepID=UPI002610046C